MTTSTEHPTLDFLSKVAQEQEAYLTQVQALPPAELIAHAPQITLFSQFRSTLEGFAWNEISTLAMAKLETPLANMLRSYEQRQGLPAVEKFVKEFVADRTKTYARALYENPHMPRYPEIWESAQAHGEEALYLASLNRDGLCVSYLNEHCESAHMQGNLRGFVANDWVKRFGRETCTHVLGDIVDQKEFDGRFDRACITHAQKKDYPENGQRHTSNVHSILLNFVYRELMELETPRKTQVNVVQKTKLPKTKDRER